MRRVLVLKRTPKTFVYGQNTSLYSLGGLTASSPGGFAPSGFPIYRATETATTGNHEVSVVNATQRILGNIPFVFQGEYRLGGGKNVSTFNVVGVMHGVLNATNLTNEYSEYSSLTISSLGNGWVLATAKGKIAATNNTARLAFALMTDAFAESYAGNTSHYIEIGRVTFKQ